MEIGISQLNKKKYIRKIPADLLLRIEQTTSESVRVGQVFPIADFLAIQQKFGVQILDGEIVCTQPLPEASTGSWSKKNVNGWVEVHKNQPKEPYSRTFDAPNFGDPAKGYHEVEITGMRYPRTQHGAKMIGFAFRLLKVADLDFVEVYLDKSIPLTASYEVELFFQLNLFCENIGSLGILLEDECHRPPVTAVTWQIFPTMPLEEIQERLTGPIQDPVRRQRAVEVVADRYNFFQSLDATEIIVGNDGFTRYFGAVFQDKVAFFECINYGNAIYLLGEDWRELTQLSRTELLTTPGLRYERIVHTKNWKQKARQELKRMLDEAGDDGPEDPPAAAPIAA